jgi:hypothetical protein
VNAKGQLTLASQYPGRQRSMPSAKVIEIDTSLFTRLAVWTEIRGDVCLVLSQKCYVDRNRRPPRAAPLAPRVFAWHSARVEARHINEDDNMPKGTVK